MAGFSQGGGVGLALSQWMVEGDPGADIWGMDVARYGDWATLAYTNAKVRENYSRRFRIRFPNEELPAGRPFRTSPIYDRLVAENAVMGEGCGIPISASRVGATSARRPSSNCVPLAALIATMGTSKVVCAVWGSPVLGSFIISILP